MVGAETKQTVVVGATPNTNRYAWLASEMLSEDGFPFIPLGIKKGEVLGKEILDIREQPKVEDVHTLTLYVGASNLAPYHEYLLSLRPKRIIFNPGAENSELYQAALKQGIEVIEACTLVMLRSRQF
ncbi:MAG TPA: CoA-binding protein [Cytophagales bacterium]|nr:CoA-binding protein [Cytophagales bacterium]HAA17324.1 CoA-binding protein [Cytophagales bacterium]HAP62985.1 CoA-binding protein [Cytophagales bacterium]